MRSDMAKVIVESARSGMRYKTPKGSRRELQDTPIDEYPKQEKIRRKWLNGWNGKQSIAVLGPLRGYVLSVVGRKFDDVFSEINQVLRPAGVAGRHARDYLWQMLVTKVYIDSDGLPYHNDRIYSNCNGKPTRRRISTVYHFAIAYVDPRDGIIKKTPQTTIKPKHVKAPIFWIDAYRYYRLISGAWFLVTLASGQPERRESSVIKGVFYDVIALDGFDVVAKQTLVSLGLSGLRCWHGVEDRYAVDKRQLNKREIRRLKLWERLNIR
jgi:hypothetical protein